jgi:MFS family permease
VIPAFVINALGASLLLVTLGKGLGDAEYRGLADKSGVYMEWWPTLRLLGLAGAGRWIGEIAFAPVAGYASDHFGRRPVLISGGLLAAGALGGCAFAPNEYSFVAAAMFAFAMLSSMQTALDALATDRARQSAVSLGRYFTVVDVGLAVGPLVGPALVEEIGFAKTAICSAGVVALVAGAYMRGGRDDRADHAGVHADR